MYFWCLFDSEGKISHTAFEDTQTSLSLAPIAVDTSFDKVPLRNSTANVFKCVFVSTYRSSMSSVNACAVLQPLEDNLRNLPAGSQKSLSGLSRSGVVSSRVEQTSTAVEQGNSGSSWSRLKRFESEQQKFL